LNRPSGHISQKHRENNKNEEEEDRAKGGGGGATGRELQNVHSIFSSHHDPNTIYMGIKTHPGMH